MNCSIVLTEEKQIIYYDFIKKLFNLLFKTITSNINFEAITVNSQS